MTSRPSISSTPPTAPRSTACGACEPGTFSAGGAGSCSPCDDGAHCPPIDRLRHALHRAVYQADDPAGLQDLYDLCTAFRNDPAAPWDEVAGKVSLRRAAALIADPVLARSGLRVHEANLPTFPSWRPRRGIDHILTSPGLEVVDAGVIDAVLSDHRPVHMRIVLPPRLAAAFPGAARPAPAADRPAG